MRVRTSELVGVSRAPPPSPPVLRRFYGRVDLNPIRVARDAGEIVESVIGLLSTLDGAEVTVTLDIHARLPGGVPDKVRMDVTENARTLKFQECEFEAE